MEKLEFNVKDCQVMSPMITLQGTGAIRPPRAGVRSGNGVDEKAIHRVTVIHEPTGYMEVEDRWPLAWRNKELCIARLKERVEARIAEIEAAEATADEV